MCWSRARQVKGRDEPEEQSSEKGSAVRSAEQREDQRRKGPERDDAQRLRGVDAQNAQRPKPEEFRAEKENE